MSSEFYLTAFFVVFILTTIVSIVATFHIKGQEFVQKIKLDITKQQMIESETRIKEFLAKHNITAKCCISEIAKIFNVKQGDVEPNLNSQACIKEIGQTGEKVVVFKTELSEEDRLFIFAHELAHLVNGDSIPANRPNGRNKAHVEQLADYTAAALLMPIEEIYDFLTVCNYEKVSVRKRSSIIRQLCKKYSVTEVIALRRVKEVQVVKQAEC